MARLLLAAALVCVGGSAFRPILLGGAALCAALYAWETYRASAPRLKALEDKVAAAQATVSKIANKLGWSRELG